MASASVDRLTDPAALASQFFSEPAAALTAQNRAALRSADAPVRAHLARFGLTLEGLLTVGASNAKLAKGAALARSVILHHLPARSLSQAVYGAAAGPTAPRSRIEGLEALALRNEIGGLVGAHDGCPWASAGCRSGCLAWAGHGGISTTVASCRARRTMAFIYNPGGYAVAVLWALAREYKKAQAQGLPLAYRLRGTDDLPWHEIRFTLYADEARAMAHRYGLPVVPGIGTTIPEALALAPGLRPYEYSKAPLEGPYGLRAQRAAGVDTTASLAADRPQGLARSLEAVAAGFRLAVPAGFAKGWELPSGLLLRADSLSPVVRLACLDGDLTDHRWTDPQGPQALVWDGVAVILRTKRSAGAGAASKAFSLSPVVGEWQALAGGGLARWEA